jgi:hypothetical protein
VGFESKCYEPGCTNRSVRDFHITIGEDFMDICVKAQVRVCVCVCVCMYIPTYVLMYVCRYACSNPCMCAYVCIYVHMYLRMYLCRYVCRLRVCNVNPSNPVVLCVTIPERSKAFPLNITSVGVDRGESNGKLPLRICPGCSVPEPYQSPD